MSRQERVIDHSEREGQLETLFIMPTDAAVILWSRQFMAEQKRTDLGIEGYKRISLQYENTFGRGLTPNDLTGILRSYDINDIDLTAIRMDGRFKLDNTVPAEYYDQRFNVPELNSDMLKTDYFVFGRSVTWISEHYNVSYNYVNYWIKQHAEQFKQNDIRFFRDEKPSQFSVDELQQAYDLLCRDTKLSRDQVQTKLNFTSRGSGHKLYDNMMEYCDAMGLTYPPVRDRIDLRGDKNLDEILAGEISADEIARIEDFHDAFLRATNSPFGNSMYRQMNCDDWLIFLRLVNNKIRNQTIAQIMHERIPDIFADQNSERISDLLKWLRSKGLENYVPKKTNYPD